MKPEDKNYAEKWKQVDAFVDQGLTRSALLVIDKIFAEAKSEGNETQFIKALIYRVSLQGQFEENHLVGAINQFEAELGNAKGIEKQLLQSLLAELYHRFYMENRWLINERTAVADAENTSIQTWSAVQFNQIISDLYLNSIANKQELTVIKLSDFSPILLNTENNGFALWPSLYDLLANRALDYFSTSEASLATIGSQLSIPATELFSPANDFVKKKFIVADKLSFQYQALLIYQQLLAFHLKSGNINSIIDLDLRRLEFVSNQLADNETNRELYTQALENLFDQYQNDPVSGQIAFRLASRYQASGNRFNPSEGEQFRFDLKRAAEICEAAIKAFPDTDASNACRNLLMSIIEVDFSLQAKSAEIPGNQLLALLSFRNTTRLYFKIVELDPITDLESSLNQNERDLALKYLDLAAVEEWSQELPDTKDYQTHTAEIGMPALPKGYYLIFISNDEKFNPISNIIFNPIWITSLSYLTSNNRNTGSLELYVIDRESGNPVQEVKLALFDKKYDSRNRKYLLTPTGNFQTDKNGFISINQLADQSRNSLIFSLEKDGDILHSEGYLNVYKSVQETRTTTTTYFFTDRAIYRPGQAVYFKGIVVDKTGNQVEIKPGYSSTISFFDANRKEVSKLDLVTNEFGSFQGAFVIPTGGLNGEMRIRNQSGSARFSVEEYKRPTFRVNFDTLAGQYKLGDTINLTGKAENYTGSAVMGAMVKYRVVRAQMAIPFVTFYRPFPRVQEVEIANGVVETAPDGTFQISFIAKSGDLIGSAIPFNFVVTADVTELTGEVQSAVTSVNIGNDAIILLLDMPEIVQIESKDETTLSAVNFSGAPIEVEANVEIYKLTPPDRLLNNRYWSRPDLNLIPREEFIEKFPHEIYKDEDNREKWSRSLVYSAMIALNGKYILQKSTFYSSDPGEYLISIIAKNQTGDTARLERFFSLFSLESKQIPGNPVSWAIVPETKAEPGEIIHMAIGSSAKKTRILYEVINGEEIILRDWITVNAGQKVIEIPVQESFRGDFGINVKMIRFNRFYNNNFIIQVPFSNKKLDITLETHRDFLVPGQKEEWRVKITGPEGEKLAAELMAGMYDASLDQFRANNWHLDLFQSKSNNSFWNSGFFRAEFARSLNRIPMDFVTIKPVLYPQINWFGYEGFFGNPGFRGGAMDYAKSGIMMADGQAEKSASLDEAVPNAEDEEKAETAETAESVTSGQNHFLRTNFNETAFFFPQLQTDSLGNVVFTFTTPDALTEWKLMMLATTKDLKTGDLVQLIKAKKDLMIIPNVPRFVRQGDVLLFSAKLVNFTDGPITAEASIEFFDALTMKPVNIFSNNEKQAKKVSMDARQSSMVSWQINIPFDVSMLGYRITAQSGLFTDGEERIFPVLSNRMLVTETMPLNINGNQSKSFNFKKLTDSDKIMMMSTRQNYSFTVEFTSNPAWYAVQALPYLDQPTVENASALFHVFYVNALSAHLINHNPKIRNVVETWKALTPEAFYSKLQTNQELKNILLEATPWVLEAENQTEQKRRIGILFDLNRIANEKETTLNKLRQNQMPGGAWPWFKGMKEDRHTTQSIVLGIGRLNRQGVINLKSNAQLLEMTKKAVGFLDFQIREDFEHIKKNSSADMKKRVPGSLQIEYLYARSLLLDLMPVPQESADAFAYFVEQASKFWLKQDIYFQAMTALTLYRLDQRNEAEGIMRSILERGLTDEEMGLYWRNEAGWNWYQAPVETQALIIQALDEVMNNQTAVEQAKIWLLKQKQTTHWATNQATVEAIYALLMTGRDLLDENIPVNIKVGGQEISQVENKEMQMEAGTDYFKKSWHSDEVKANLGNIKITNPNAGIAWGGAYWQYFENLDRIIQHDSPLKIEKQLFLETMTDQGPVLQPLTENQALETGDKVVVRLIISSDREMEYVHIKDMRATAFEPAERLSGYSWKGGLGFYRNVSDVSTDFFIQNLPKGMFLLEYPVFVTQRGEFSNGIATIQSYYAPEFAAHSEGLRLVVK